MFTPTITLGAVAYDLVTQNPYRSMRFDATQSLASPNSLTISHETAKTGTRSSVLIFEDIDVLSTSTSIIKDSVKTQFKCTFKPLSGRADIEAVINAHIVQLQAFLAVPENITKFLNQES
jgi:hypothetical protein